MGEVFGAGTLSVVEEAVADMFCDYVVNNIVIRICVILFDI